MKAQFPFTSFPIEVVDSVSTDQGGSVLVTIDVVIECMVVTTLTWFQSLLAFALGTEFKGIDDQLKKHAIDQLRLKMRGMRVDENSTPGAETQRLMRQFTDSVPNLEPCLDISTKKLGFKLGDIKMIEMKKTTVIRARCTHHVPSIATGNKIRP